MGAIGGVAGNQRLANEQTSSGTVASSRMADGKEWTTTNLNVDVQPSHCYDDAEPNCRRFNRERFSRTLHRIREQLRLRHGVATSTPDYLRRLAIKDRQRTDVIDTRDIDYVDVAATICAFTSAGPSISSAVNSATSRSGSIPPNSRASIVRRSCGSTA